ncbi:MAG: M23 family metallopeptidase [Catalinimonas sp.]
MEVPPIPAYRLPDSIRQQADTTEVLEEDLDAPLPDGSDGAELRREQTMVSEDTTTLDEGYTSLIEVSEELRIDCMWVQLREYYSVWDSRRVNPYRIDGAKFRDTVDLRLYDTTAQRLWAFPIVCDTTYVTSKFGFRRYRWHYGTDLKLHTGDTVVSAFDGIVRIRSYDGSGYGYYVMVRHQNGLETLYGHLSEILVQVGQVVRAGEPLGLGGSTGRSSGAHLHYEVRFRGNAIDPTTLYDFETRALRGDRFQLTADNFRYIAEARRIIYYRIRSGDTLSGIARRHGTSVRTLCRLNGISTRTVLRIGRRLRVR